MHVLEDGSRELRFEDDFATSDGPKLEVWLVRADDAQDSGTVSASDHVSLGKFKSPTGARDYSIPQSVDLSVSKSVVVRCVAFEVNITTAPLIME